jgi:hypothetical protein
MIDFLDAIKAEREIEELRELQEFYSGPLWVWEYWDEQEIQ